MLIRIYVKPRSISAAKLRPRGIALTDCLFYKIHLPVVPLQPALLDNTLKKLPPPASLRKSLNPLAPAAHLGQAVRSACNTGELGQEFWSTEKRL